MRKIAKEHHVPVPETVMQEIGGEMVEVPNLDEPVGNFGSPKHVNMRRHVSLQQDVPMDEWEKPEEPLV
jgi:hypothetical protein